MKTITVPSKLIQLFRQLHESNRLVSNLGAERETKLNGFGIARVNYRRQSKVKNFSFDDGKFLC